MPLLHGVKHPFTRGVESPLCHIPVLQINFSLVTCLSTKLLLIVQMMLFPDRVLVLLYPRSKGLESGSLLLAT